MLAEPVEGHLNHWIVEQLMKRMSEKTSEEEGLEGPHYEDQWWLGGKSYVIFLFYLFFYIYRVVIV